VDLRGDLVAALGMPGHPVAVDSEANLAVLAEQRYGPYADTVHLAYLTGGVHLGAGLVIGGRLMRGSRGFSGAIGHIPVLPGGPACTCGRRGCLEAVAGIPALIRRAVPGADLPSGVDEVLCRAKANDPTTVDALAETGRWLGDGAALLANLIDVDVVILGGDFAPLAPWLLASATAALSERTVAPRAGGCRIVPTTLGPESPALGAAARILDLIDAGHIPRLSQ
jgi:predicted NBD/HSP70 family sugar kinase